MKLLTAANRSTLPALYSQESQGLDAIVHVKFFLPGHAGSWYVTEFDGRDSFFGLADLGMGRPELGYFSLAEIESVRGRYGPMERDLHWKPVSLRECRVLNGHGQHVAYGTVGS